MSIPAILSIMRKMRMNKTVDLAGFDFRCDKWKAIYTGLQRVYHYFSFKVWVV